MKEKEKFSKRSNIKEGVGGRIAQWIAFSPIARQPRVRSSVKALPRKVFFLDVAVRFIDSHCTD